MDSTRMIAKMRQIEQAVPPELEQLVILQKKETLPNGTVINYYEENESPVTCGSGISPIPKKYWQQKWTSILTA